MNWGSWKANDPPEVDTGVTNMLGGVAGNDAAAMPELWLYRVGCATLSGTG